MILHVWDSYCMQRGWLCVEKLQKRKSIIYILNLEPFIDLQPNRKLQKSCPWRREFTCKAYECVSLRDISMYMWVTNMLVLICFSSCHVHLVQLSNSNVPAFSRSFDLKGWKMHPNTLFLLLLDNGQSSLFPWRQGIKGYFYFFLFFVFLAYTTYMSFPFFKTLALWLLLLCLIKHTFISDKTIQPE